MSVVIVGGNERMVRTYQDICGEYGFKSKVFVKEKGSLKKKIGNPDLLILFTSTVSHTMTQAACELARKKKVTILRSHTSSLAALDGLLREFGKEKGHVACV